MSNFIFCSLITEYPDTLIERRNLPRTKRKNRKRRRGRRNAANDLEKNVQL